MTYILGRNHADEPQGTHFKAGNLWSHMTWGLWDLTVTMTLDGYEAKDPKLL